LASFFFPGTNHLVEGGKKNASYIASLFEPWIQKLNPTGVCVNFVFLWSKQYPKGRSNSCGKVPLHSCSNLCCSLILAACIICLGAELCTAPMLYSSTSQRSSMAVIRLDCLRLKDALLATISLVAYKDLELRGFAKKAEAYVPDADMWEATFVLQRCLFPMICVLRLGDKSACGGMSKIIYFVHKTDKAIRNSMELLRDLK
jgi:hypothetical protein